MSSDFQWRLASYLDKLAHVQVFINCQYLFAQMCTHRDTLAHILGAPFLDDVMSYNSLTTHNFNWVKMVDFKLGGIIWLDFYNWKYIWFLLNYLTSNKNQYLLCFVLVKNQLPFLKFDFDCIIQLWLIIIIFLIKYSTLIWYMFKPLIVLV